METVLTVFIEKLSELQYFITFLIIARGIIFSFRMLYATVLTHIDLAYCLIIIISLCCKVTIHLLHTASTQKELPNVFSKKYRVEYNADYERCQILKHMYLNQCSSCNELADLFVKMQMV